MSLQPGINPLDQRQKVATRLGRPFLGATPDESQRIATPMAPGMRTMEVRDQHRSFPSAEEMERRMQGGIPNMGGFDPSDLMSRPEIRQEETRNQANMVSAPYEQANRMAAEKTNPMNAESQNPGKIFLMKFIGK